MMRGPSRVAALMLACLPLCASCRRSPEPGDTSSATPDTSAAATLYRRRLLFVGGTPDSLVTALFHFTSAPEADRQVRHAAYGWIGSGIGWDPVMTEEWRGDALRDPGMILPHGKMRLVAGSRDELTALQYGGARLERGTRLAEWAQPDAIGVTLDVARLRVNGRSLDGALLAARDAPQAPPTPADSATTLEGLLTDGSGTYIVLEQRGDIPAASLQVAAAGDVSRSGSLSVRPDSAGAVDEDGRPTAWLIIDGAGRRVGSLHRIGPGWAGTSGQLGYRQFDGVRGEVRQEGRRYRIAGILERRAR